MLNCQATVHIQSARQRCRYINCMWQTCPAEYLLCKAHIHVHIACTLFVAHVHTHQPRLYNRSTASWRPTTRQPACNGQCCSCRLMELPPLVIASAADPQHEHRYSTKPATGYSTACWYRQPPTLLHNHSCSSLALNASKRTGKATHHCKPLAQDRWHCAY